MYSQVTQDLSVDLNIIVCVDEDGGFGKDGEIPWHMKEDMQHFKETTHKSVCVMGRHTYSDMIGMRLGDQEPASDFVLLPSRSSYVITSDVDFKCHGATAIRNLSDVIQTYKKTDTKVFILGGYRMFIAALSYKPTIHMTIIKGDAYDCDVFFPISLSVLA